MEDILVYYRTQNIVRIVYKAIPFIYHEQAAEEDLYALFRHGFSLAQRQVSTTVYLKNNHIHSNRKNGYNKCLKKGVAVKECNDFETFFSMVNTRLNNKYEVKAVHTPIEMQMLHKAFPLNIRLFGVFLEKTTNGWWGTVIHK